MRFFLFAIAFVGLMHLTTLSQSKANDILQKRIEKSFSHAYTLEVLSHLAVEYKVPIGIEWAENHDSEIEKNMYLENGSIRWKPGVINIAPGSLKDVLESLVRQNPHYEWELIDGVINVYPVKSRDTFLAELLNIKVKGHSLAVNDEKFVIRDLIYDIPEVQAFTTAHGVATLRRYYSYKKGETRDPGPIERLGTVSLRDVLNTAIRLTENKMWAIKRTGGKKEYLELTF